VRDIDSADLEDPHQAAEYVDGIVGYLHQREKATLVRPGHLVGCPTTSQVVIRPFSYCFLIPCFVQMREILVDWLVEVQGQFKLLQETLFSTVDIVDRYLAKEGKRVVKKHLQLLGVTAMFVAAKVEEVYAPSLSDFVWITDQAYTEAEIKRMEIKVIGALDFELTQPTALMFLRRFSKAAEADAVQHCLAKYAVEASLLECELVPVARSELAAAALLLGRVLLEPAGAAVWDQHLAHWTGYTKDQLMPTAGRLAVTIRRIGAAGCRVEATRKKFQGGKLQYVADRPELQGAAMARLAAGQL
jgi:hypothetical protein